jgi:hypothetical protein
MPLTTTVKGNTLSTGPEQVPSRKNELGQDVWHGEQSRFEVGVHAELWYSRVEQDEHVVQLVLLVLVHSPCRNCNPAEQADDVVQATQVGLLPLAVQDPWRVWPLGQLEVQGWHTRLLVAVGRAVW